MVRKYYPFFFQILDPKGEPLYLSGVSEIGYPSYDKVLTNARNRKKTREDINICGRIAFSCH